MTGFFSRLQTADDIMAFQNSGDLSALIGLLGHHNSTVREKAILALGTSGQQALPHLAAALNSRNGQVRLGAVGAMGIIHDPATVLSLSEVLRNDRLVEVRLAALLALGETGDPEAVSSCVAALTDRNRYIRYGAAVALGKLLWEPEDTALWAYYFIALQDWDALRSLGSTAAVPIRMMLKDDDPGIRMQLMDLLSQTGSPEAAAGCTQLLRDPRDSVRYAALLSAVKSGQEAQCMPLLFSERQRTGPNPAAAALLNFLFFGIGYNYMGKWWGFLVFMSYMSIIVLAQLQLGPFLPFLLAYPVTALFAVQTYREAKRMADRS
jgi:hypothetical protein